MSSTKKGFPGPHVLFSTAALMRRVSNSERTYAWYAELINLHVDWISRVAALSRAKTLPAAKINHKGVCTNPKAIAGFSAESLALFAEAIYSDEINDPRVKEPRVKLNPEIVGWVWVILYWLKLDPVLVKSAIDAELVSIQPGDTLPRYTTFVMSCNPPSVE